MNCNGVAKRSLAMEWHRTATQGLGLAVEGDAMKATRSYGTAANAKQGQSHV